MSSFIRSTFNQLMLFPLSPFLFISMSAGFERRNREHAWIANQNGCSRNKIIMPLAQIHVWLSECHVCLRYWSMESVFIVFQKYWPHFTFFSLFDFTLAGIFIVYFHSLALRNKCACISHSSLSLSQELYLIGFNLWVWSWPCINYCTLPSLSSTVKWILVLCQCAFWPMKYVCESSFWECAVFSHVKFVEFSFRLQLFCLWSKTEVRVLYVVQV